MSRMPGRGTSPGSCVMGSALRGQSWRREWHRIAAERQQLLERGAQFRAKGVEASVRDRDNAFHLDQIDHLAAIAARDEGAYQPDGRQQLRDRRPTDRRGTFCTEQRAIETALLLSAPPDRQRISIGTGVAAPTERQARDDPRRVV